MSIDIQKDVSLQAYNTFGMSVHAHHFASIHNEAQLKQILSDSHWQQQSKLILGGGSNLLFTQDVAGLVIKMNIKGIEKIKEDDDHVWLQVGAGEDWHQLVRYCVEHGYGGIENLSLIPGTVGAAPIQNIGAYGVELRQTFEHLNAIQISDGKAVTFNHRDCEFGYRDSVFKHRFKNQFIITSVTLRLDKKPEFILSYGAVQKTLENMAIEHIDLRAISNAIIQIRQRKLPDPKIIGNAGSFFKNPEIPPQQFSDLQQYHPSMPSYPTDNSHIKVPAGWLIEQCGWKGKRVGNVGVHDKQSLVLVNHGQGTGKEIQQLAAQIQDSVQSKFQILLQPEVNIV